MPGLIAARLILVNRPTIAAWLESFRIWPEGLAFELCVSVPPGSFPTSAEGFPAIEFDLRHPRERADLFELGVSAAGRRTSTASSSTWPGGSAEAADFVLSPLAGGGGGSDETGGDWRVGWWLTPLPDAECVEFWCAWPRGGLDRRAAQLNGTLLAAAAIDTVALWSAS